MSPSLCPRWTPSAPRRFASAMLSLTMKATPASAQMRCSGSAAGQLVIFHVLDAQLEGRRDAGFERGLQAVGKAPPTSCGLIRYSFAGSGRSGRGGNSMGSNSLRPRSGRHLDGRSLVDFVDGAAERPVEFLVALLGAKVGQQRAAEAGDHAGVRASSGRPRHGETAGKSDDASAPWGVRQAAGTGRLRGN